MRLRFRSGRFREEFVLPDQSRVLALAAVAAAPGGYSAPDGVFLAKYAKDFRRPKPELSARTQQLFLEYAWPGNVCELEDAAKAIVALGDEALAMGGLRAMLQRSDRGHNGEPFL